MQKAAFEALQVKRDLMHCQIRSQVSGDWDSAGTTSGILSGQSAFVSPVLRTHVSREWHSPGLQAKFRTSEVWPIPGDFIAFSSHIREWPINA